MGTRVLGWCRRAHFRTESGVATLKAHEAVSADLIGRVMMMPGDYETNVMRLAKHLDLGADDYLKAFTELVRTSDTLDEEILERIWSQFHETTCS